MPTLEPRRLAPADSIELSTAPLAGDGQKNVATLRFRGDLVTATIADRTALLDTHEERLAASHHIVIDLSDVARLDTAGGWLVNRLRDKFTGDGRHVVLQGVSADQQAMLDVIHVQALDEKPDRHANHYRAGDLVRQVGVYVRAIGDDLRSSIDLLGTILVIGARLVRHPRRLRINAMVHHMDKAGLRAVPIILVMAFLIGVIVAQQSAFQLSQFGADLFVVDLVGILVLREMGVLITAVMLAGRSGSAFTAEIGSMRMREEIDAMKVIGLDPIEVLVMPRVLALVLVLPLLTFIADIAAILGGALVSNLYSGISWDVFVERLRVGMGMGTIVLGFIKAPFMAVVIAVIGCSEGLRVAGSAESLGVHTTASVVKSLFMVVILDGIFAVFFTAIGI